MRLLCYAYVVSLFVEGYTFSLLFRKSETIPQYVGTLMLIAFLFYRLRSYRIPKGDCRWIAAFTFVITAQEVWRYFTLSGEWWQVSWERFFLHAQVLMMFFLIHDTCQDLRALRGTIVTFALSVVVTAVMTAAGIGVTVTAEGRTGIAGIDLNQLGWIYATVLVGIYSYFLSVRWKLSFWRLVVLALSPIVFAALVRSGSRGAFLSLAAGLVISSLVNFQWRRVPLIAFALLSVAAVGIYELSTDSVLSERLAQSVAGQDLGKRDILAAYTWELILQKPLMGWGGGYLLALGPAINRPRAGAHNTYLQVLVSFGAVGMIPFIGAWFKQWWDLWKRRFTLLGSIALCTALTAAVFQLTGHKSYDKHFWLFFALSSNIALLAPNKLTQIAQDLGKSRRTRHHASVSGLSSQKQLQA